MGVVLACNNYEVVDLGVMVPASKILSEAKKLGSNIIGLSGLITPSLDEMVHVAKEMNREGFGVPLLIGGATTSPAHTAIKIAVEYENPVVYVEDASRVINILNRLLGEDTQADFLRELKESQNKTKAEYLNRRSEKEYLSIEKSRSYALSTDWDAIEDHKAQTSGHSSNRRY